MTNASPTTAIRFARLLPSWAGLWARDSALLVTSQTLTVVATSLAAILVARNLAPSDWGIFSAFLGVSFALAVFVEFGLATWLLRELSRLFADRGSDAVESARRLMAAAMSGMLVVTAIIVTFGTVVGIARENSAVLVVTLSSLLLYGGLFAGSNVLESYLRARRRLRRLVGASIIEKWVLLMLLVTALAADWGLAAIGLSYVIAGVLRVSILGTSVFGRERPPRPSLAEVRSIWSRSLPFALSAGGITVVPMLDVLFLLALSSTSAGYFALGVRVLGPAVMVAAVSATALYPFFARRTHRGHTIWALCLAFGIAGSLLALAGVLVAPALVPLVFGTQYTDAVPVVQLMLLTLPLAYIANPLLAHGFSCGRERVFVAGALAAAFVGTAAILLGQGFFGTTGAAVGFVARQALQVVVFLIATLFLVRSQRRAVAPEAAPRTDATS